MQCKEQNHSNFKAAAICLESNCKSKHRLACPKCICEIHFQHTKSCVFIDDILKRDEQIKNWSNEEISKKVNLIKEHLSNDNEQEKCEPKQNFGNEIENFENKLVESIDFQRTLLKNKYLKYKDQMDKILKLLSVKFSLVFDIKPILALLRSYLKRSITRIELCQQVKLIISNEARKITIKEMDQLFRKRMKLCAEYNKTQFKDIQGQTVKDLALLPQIIQTGSFNFLVPKIGAFNNLLKELETGKVFGFNNLDQQQYIYGNKIFKGQKEFFWSLKFEDIPPNTYNSIYIGVVVDSKKEDINSLFQVGTSAYIDVVNQALSNCMITKKKNLTETIRKRITNKESFIIKIKLDLISKLFQVTDDRDEIEYEYSLKTVKAQSQHNLYNSQLHQQFFSNYIKLRPFVLAYSSTAKITLLDS